MIEYKGYIGVVEFDPNMRKEKPYGNKYEPIPGTVRSID